MIIRLLWIFVCLPSMVVGQTEATGIHFESNLSWKQIKAKAAVEKKYIFVDCYATWCGPCKRMQKEIFPQDKVGRFFNDHFINVAVQLDRTKNDDQYVKGWYDDAENMAKTFSITAYPTFLFFSADGRPVHKFIGASGDAEGFLAKSSEALDSATQYFTLVDHWESHTNDSAFLVHALSMAQSEEDWGLARKIAAKYLACIKEKITKKNVELIHHLGLITSSHDEWFQLFLRNANQINEMHESINGKKMFVEWALQRVIFKEEVLPALNSGTPFFWNKVRAGLIQKYPSLPNLSDLIKQWFLHYAKNKINLMMTGGELSQMLYFDFISDSIKKNFPDYNLGDIFLDKKANCYLTARSWDKCAEVGYELIHQYGNNIDPHSLNDAIWNYIFLHCKDRKILFEALKWEKVSVDLSPNDAALDTYANLLYKLGKKKEALKWENKALELGTKMEENPDDWKVYQVTIDKMKKNKPTWEG